MKKIILILSLAFTFALNVQSFGQRKAFYNTGYPTILSDTVTNTATNTLGNILAINTVGSSVTIQVVATKISGTVAGTISLQGSLDGANFKALTIAEASTAIPTFTATDVASQTFIWRITGNPVPFYRISWTGAGTMAASFVGQAYIR